MEDNKKIKIGLIAGLFVITVIIIAVIVILVFVGIRIFNESKTTQNTVEFEESSTAKSDLSGIKTEKYNGKTYYVLKDDYKGDYDIQYLKLSQYFNSDEELDYDMEGIYSYDIYKDFCSTWDINQKYKDESKKYAIIAYSAYGQPIIKARLAAVEYDSDTLDAYVWDYSRGVTADVSAYTIIIPVDKSITELNVNEVYTEEEFDNLQNYSSTENPNMHVTYKPIIYLYPTQETNISVKLLNKDKVTCSYPKYTSGWNVKAKPNGNLIDLDGNRNLYALYYESDNIYNYEVKEDGFVVKGEDVAAFLEEKLAVLGLTDREAEEFIVYWLPKLEGNKYNYIRFATTEEINKNMPIEITPTPDTFIRIIMTYKGLAEKIDVKEQQLTTPNRDGYVAVEWGGTEIK